LRDVGDEPGALPLLSHALLETWKSCKGRTLTFVDYHTSGGVRGSIVQTASVVFKQLILDQQVIARNIFWRLTEVGEGTPDTRRRAMLTELMPRAERQAATETVLKILVDARLITASEEVIEIAHEVLIYEWPELHQWLDGERERLIIHRRLARAAQEWESKGKDEGYLYRGKLLEQA